MLLFVRKVSCLKIIADGLVVKTVRFWKGLFIIVAQEVIRNRIRSNIGTNLILSFEISCFLSQGIKNVVNV